MNDRLITVRLQSGHTTVTINPSYAPTYAATDQDKNEFYEQLLDALNAALEHEIKIIMADLNAQIGSDNAGWEI
jgi:hypothetical protein